MTPIFLEVHADEQLLRQEPARWDQAASLLDTLCKRAEQEGACLSLRVRETMVEADTFGFLQGLIRRGHEVGWHSHGEDPTALIEAMRQKSLDVSVCTPGLVQAKERGRTAVLRRALEAGARCITDRTEQRWFSYQGWLAWWPLPNLRCFDVSVSPFEWGVLEKRWGRVYHRFGGLDWEGLARKTESWSRWPVPRGYAAFFGATFHEHNLCAPDSLLPLESELDAFSRYCSRFGPRILASSHIPVPPPPADPPPSPPKIAPVRRLQLRLSRWSAPPIRSLSVGQRRIRYQLVGEPTTGALVVIHAGKSGLLQGLSFLGLPLNAFEEAGIGVYLFERSEESFGMPGNPVHRADARAVFEKALEAPVPVGLLSWSAGLVPASVLAREGRAAFLVDAEGPIDRFSLVPPWEHKEEWQRRAPADDPAWEGMEAASQLPFLQIPYLRLQGSLDHVHGPMTVHARRAVDLCPNGKLLLVAGALRDHPERLKQALLQQFSATA